MSIDDVIQLQTQTGDPWAVGDAVIRPESKSLVLRWPNGGYVWNRPTAVVVERNGQTERLPIVDVTRIAHWSLVGLALLFLLGARG